MIWMRLSKTYCEEPAASDRPGAWRLRGAVVALLLLGCWAGCSARAAVASGIIIQQRGHGLLMTVDNRWGDGFGYRPVRITFAPTAAGPADRVLTVEFLTHLPGRYGRSDLRVEQEVEIPAGAGKVQASLSVPHYGPSTSCEVKVFEDGQPLEKLYTSLPQPYRGGEELKETFPVVLIVGRNLPDTSRLLGPFPNEPYQRLMQQSLTRSGPPTFELPTAAACGTAELSDRWIDYSSLDVLCISMEELAELKQQRPGAFRAVLDWTAAGGNLWVYGVGWDWQRLDDLRKLVKLPPAVPETADLQTRGWQKPHGSLYGLYFRGAWKGSSRTIAQNFGRSRGRPLVGELPQTANPQDQLQGSPQRPHFVQREYGMGLILALASEDPFPGTDDEWRCVLSSVGAHRLLWYRRHGVSMRQPNPDYMEFLIPGVGLAPVTEFVVLITLFVLVVGPVNYWLLQRRHRLYLLVVTIPGSAAAVTLLLFIYAVLADGLRTRVRVRSVTHIDQQRKQAACWARLSYYAGLAPGDGLAFSDDVVVLPVEEVPSDRRGNREGQRELIWETDQRLRSGWLASRTPTQYLTVRSRATDRGLQLLDPAGQGETMRVKNLLGVEILQLAVCSPAGQCYLAGRIDAGAVAALQPVTWLDALAPLEQACRDNKPVLPISMRTRRGGDILDIYSGRRGHSRSRSGRLMLDLPSQDAGRLEQLLALQRSSGRPGSPPLQPGSYVAVVEHSPEVELGTAAAREEASFHVILGKW